MRIHSGYFMFKYILEEFFRVKNGRTVFGYNTSKRSNVLWSVPLRLFFGLALFLDGMANVNDSVSFLVTAHPGLGALEIVLGALIFLGLFTWLANLIVIILFFFAMLTWPTTWALFVALALMNGSGRSFGLDYWFVPWLQKTWGRSRYGVPQSIYKK